MAFISTYFASYQEYLDYYGKYADTYYHYVLKAYGETELVKINPAGGDELNIKYLRHEFYDSVFRNFALSLKWFRKRNGGAELILSAYDNYDILAEIEVEIWFRNHLTYDYELLYSGVLDLKPEKLTIDRDFVECGIIDNGKLDKFIARDNLKLDISQRKSIDDVLVPEFDVQDGIDVIFIPINIYNQASATLFNNINQALAEPEAGSPARDIENYCIADTIEMNPVPDRLKIINVESELGETPSDEPIEVFYENNLNTESEITLFLTNTFQNNFLSTPSGFWEPFACQLIQVIYLLDDTGDEDVYTEIVSTGYNIDNEIDFNAAFYLKNIIFDFSSFDEINITVPAGNKVIFRTEFNLGESFSGANFFRFFTYQQNLNFNFSFKEKSIGAPKSVCKHYLGHDVLSRLIQLTTSETDTSKLLRSNILGSARVNYETYSTTGDAGNLAFTIGKALRRFPDYEMYYSIRDFVQFMKSAYNTGLGYDIVNDRFYLEKITTFYDDSFTIFDVKNVSNFKIKPYSQAYYNEIKAGYVASSVDAIQGAREFNDERTYSTRSTVKSTYDLQSPILAGSIYIEQLRRIPYFKYPLDDNGNDLTNFVVGTKYNAVLDSYLANKIGANASGFDGVDEYYNFDLTPRKNLLRNMSRVKSQLWKSPEKVKLSSKQNSNYQLTYTDALSNEYSDFEDISKDENGEVEIFQPKIAEIEGTITAADIVTLNNNPHGVITFEYESETYEGFLVSLETSGNTRYVINVKCEIVLKEKTGQNYIFEDDKNYIFEDENNHTFE